MRFPIVFATWAGWSLAGLAAGNPDPFSTEAMTPRKPSPALAARATAAPCATALPATPLGVIDAVDLALCNNPQTGEAWAAARLQAAQLGVAQSAWLPSLDGRLAANRTWVDGTGINQRTAALTLSWLLFDFGARAAGVESARQLLLAASASQDAIMALFGELNREGITIVLVTHEPDIAKHAKRQVRFLDGHIVSDQATPEAAAC